MSDHEEIIRIKSWIWGPGPNEDNGANASLKAIWSAIRGMQKTLWMAAGAIIILQPLVIAAIVKWLV